VIVSAQARQIISGLLEACRWKSSIHSCVQRLWHVSRITYSVVIIDRLRSGLVLTRVLIDQIDPNDHPKLIVRKLNEVHD